MTEKFLSVFKTERPIIGMLHLLGNTRQGIVDNAIKEMKMMTKHGVAAVLVENYFGDETDVENTLAALQKEYPNIVYGVNVLGDMKTAFALAKKYDAKFIQVDSICGHLYPESEKKYYERVDALRAECDALLLGGVRFKYQPVYSGRSLEEDLEIGKLHCDAIVVTGTGTGISTELDKIKEFRSVLGEFPLLVGAGMTADTVGEQLSCADGGIVGSYFKYGGDAYGYMDENRVIKLMAEAKRQEKSFCSDIDTVDRPAVKEACRKMDEIHDLPEKRMREYYENHYSALHPLVQSYYSYLLYPYYINEASLAIPNDDARAIIDYLTYHPSGNPPKGSGLTKESFILQYKKKYFHEKLKEHQRSLAYAYEPQTEMIEAQIKSVRPAIEALEKQIQNEQKELYKAQNEFTSRCSPKTQAVIEYEDCRRTPSSSMSGFHGFGTSYPIPFSMCGWATFDGKWGGVAFRINRDCFDGRDAVLYYMDDDFFGDLQDHQMEWLQMIRNRIEKYSSGLTDVQICEQREQNNFMFRGHSHSPTRVTTIRFRLDSSKIKETVELAQKTVPTSEIGEYIFVLPKAGEFYIELGEIIDDKRVPLHFDDFCMK